MNSGKGGVKFLRCAPGKTLGSDEEFIRKLREGGITSLREESTVENCDVILAFCPVVSRSGTSIESALETLQCLSESKPAVLVVLHHTLDPEVQVPDSSKSVNRVNTLTVDCVFQEGQGLLRCHRNQEALEKAIGWVKKQDTLQKSHTHKIKRNEQTGNSTDTRIKQLQHELQTKEKVLKHFLRMVKEKLHPIIKTADRNQRQLENSQVEDLRKLLNEAKGQLKNPDNQEVTNEIEPEKRNKQIPGMDKEMSESNTSNNQPDAEKRTSTWDIIQEDEEHGHLDEQQIQKILPPVLLKWFLNEKGMQAPKVNEEMSISDSRNSNLSEAGTSSRYITQKDKELMPFLLEWFRQDKSTQTPNMGKEMGKSEAFTSTPNKDNNTILEDEEGVTPDHQGVYNELLSTSLKEQRQDTRTKIPDGVAEASEADTFNWYRALGKIQEEEERGNTATEEQTTRKELHDSTQIPDGEEEMSKSNSKEVDLEPQKEMQDKSTQIPDEEEEMSSGSSADLRLVLLGRAGSRTSLVGNTILGLENSEAGTSTAVQRYKIRQGYVCYRNLSVLETPDEMFSSGVSQEEIRHCVRLSAPGPHAFLILIPVEESTGEERGMLEKMEEMFGEMCWRNTILLLTVTDERQKGRVEDFVRSGNQELQRLKEKCGNRIHCLNVQENRDSSQVPQLLQKIQNMVEENPERFYSRDIYQQIREMERRVMGVILRKTQKECIKCLFNKKELDKANKITKQQIKTNPDDLLRRQEKLKKKICEMEMRLRQDMTKMAAMYDVEGWIEEEKELMKIILPEVHSMLWDLKIKLRKHVT